MTYETLALIWPFLMIGFAIGTVLLVVWFQDRAERRKGSR